VDVYTPIGQTHLGEFALDLAWKSIDYFEDYINVSYPLPRLQLACIPDFELGAMENWGLVTFRDTSLLAVEGESALSALAWVADVVVHENTHMWAGDLVGPRSWEHLWLNEGVATIMPMICLSDIAPKYTSWREFYRVQTQEALVFDFSRYTHPILPDLDGATAANAIFDAVTYEKAAAVLNMLRLMLGDQQFRASFHAYFNTFKYRTASTREFANSFDESSHRNVSAFLQKWTENPGFPTVLVSRNESGYTLRQRRLLIDGTEDDLTWPVAISRSDGGETVQMEGEFAFVETADLLTFNDGRHSLAIIEYDGPLLAEVVANFAGLSLDARWMIVQDLRLLSLAGRVDPSVLVNLLLSLGAETSEDVIEAAANAALALWRAFPAVNASLASLFRPFVNLTRARDESLLTSRLRTLLLKILAVHWDDTATVKLLAPINIESAPGDLLPILLRLRGKTDFEYVVNVLETTEVPQTRSAAVTALGDTTDHVEEAFAMLWDGVRTHEVTILLASLADNPRARARVPTWFVENLGTITTHFQASGSAERLIEIAYTCLDDEGAIEEFTATLAEKAWEAEEQTWLRERELAIARIGLAARMRVT
jgi:hypothetical protein